MVVHYPRTVWKNSYAEYKGTQTIKKKKRREDPTMGYITIIPHSGDVREQRLLRVLRECDKIKVTCGRDKGAIIE